jgi:uncharacterized protein (DUF302 family)
MLYKTKTNTSPQTVKDSLANSAKEFGFGVLGSYDFKQILETKGFPIEKDITVYELCNPKGAQKVLDINPEVSVYLPCRLSIYKEDGQTVISTIDVDHMIESLDVDDAFKAHMHSIFSNLKKIMQSC